jgi:YidC/Oxa1 family membrane protein insertase
MFNFITGSFGLAIILLTLVLKIILIPFNIPSIKMQLKRGELSEELKEIQDKYKGDKQTLSKKQMELYKKHGVNPALGCLPMIIQVIVFLALYRVFITTLNGGIDPSYIKFGFLDGVTINLNFLWLKLGEPDPFYILPFLAAGSQFLLSKSMAPTVAKDKKLAKKTETNKDDMMANMQQQMLYIAPLMTFIIGLNLPSGLVLYWFASTIFSYLQNIAFKKFLYK